MELNPLQAYRVFQKHTAHLYAQLRDRWRITQSLQKDTAQFQIVIWIDAQVQVYVYVRQATIIKDLRSWLVKQSFLRLDTDKFYFILSTLQGWEKMRDHLMINDYNLKPYDILHVIVKI